MKALIALFLTLTGTSCRAANIEHLTLQAEILSISEPANVNGKANDATLVTIRTTISNTDQNWFIYETYTCERGPAFLPSLNYFHPAFRHLCYYNVPTSDTIRPYSMRSDTIILATHKSLAELRDKNFNIIMHLRECIAIHGDTPHAPILVSKEYTVSYNPDLTVFSQDIAIKYTTIWSTPDLSKYRSWYFDQ